MSDEVVNDESTSLATAGDSESSSESFAADLHAAETAATEKAPTAPVSETPTPDPRSGHIPLDAHERVLATTRQHYEQQLQQLAWAQGTSRDDAEEALALHRLYRTDPERLVSALQSMVPATSDLPGPDLQTADGAPLYSAARMTEILRLAADREAAARDAALNQRLGPIEASWQHQQRLVSADAQIEEAMRWPGFDLPANQEKITALLAEANAARRPMSIHEAYIRAVVPTLATDRAAITAEAKRALVTEMEQTTSAASGVDPARSPGPVRKKDADKDWDELIAETLKATPA